MTDDELRELQERVQLVLDLSKQPGWPLLMDRAYMGMGAKQNAILGGGIKDYQEYREALAWVSGANYVLNVPKMLQNELSAQQEVLDEAARVAQEDE